MTDATNLDELRKQLIAEGLLDEEASPMTHVEIDARDPSPEVVDLMQKSRLFREEMRKSFKAG